ncbi:MAG: UPF0758 protein [Candidatus Poribacteria bacterium]|nr:MAG: UPF0758 protein [Candidatus Poribacteria bacterium]
MRERPRDRIFEVGPEALSVAELLAALIGNSTEAVERVQRLLRHYDGDLLRLGEESPQGLTLTIGIGRAQAAQIAAAFELARRWSQFVPSRRLQVRSAKDVVEFLTPAVRGVQQEILYVLALNAKNVVTNYRPIFIGTLNASVIHPREIFHFAIDNSAASLILAHNHPSGDPEPSREDIAVTKRVVEAGRLLEIPVLDHIIIGEGRYCSLKERLLL